MGLVGATLKRKLEGVFRGRPKCNAPTIPARPKESKHDSGWDRRVAILGLPAQSRTGFSTSGAPIWRFSAFRLSLAQSRRLPDSQIADSRHSGSESSRLYRVVHLFARAA
jgi:hypothetical protein